MDSGNERIRLLVVDDEAGMRNSLEELLTEEGFAVSTAESARKAFDILRRREVDLIICDIVMPDMGGLVFLSKLELRIPVIMITAHASIENARRAFKSGAYDYLVKPFEFNELLAVINQCLFAYGIRTVRKRTSLTLESNNEQFNQMLESAKIFASTDMPVLIVGESGTGKEVISDFLVENSKRGEKVFSKINCAAIPESLLESEMFGHERGAFTGADERKIGKFEEAHGGTLLFDEIGDMDINLQAKLLRVLQDFSFQRVGGREKISVDCRIISASNQNFEEMIEKGKFREDLFHRLNGVTLKIPPLRERKEDIEHLAKNFLFFFNKKYSRNIEGYSQESLSLLKRYSWPGNVRELKNCIERAVVVCNDKYVTPEHFPDSVNLKNEVRDEASPTTLSSERDDYREDYTRRMLLEVLRKVDGNKSEAAKLMNVSRKTLYKWLRDYEIRHEYK